MLQGIFFLYETSKLYNEFFFCHDLNKLNETFDQSIIIAKDHEHLRKLKGQKDISVGILKWDPPIEDEGITTIKML